MRRGLYEGLTARLIVTTFLVFVLISGKVLIGSGRAQSCLVDLKQGHRPGSGILLMGAVT